MTRITGSLQEDQYTFLIMYLSVVVVTRNVPDESCRENQNTHFILRGIFTFALPLPTVEWDI